MKTHYTAYVFTALMTAAVISPALAQELTQGTCPTSGPITVGKMGTVEESQLQAHINQVEADLKQSKFRHARGPRLSSSRELKSHLADMRLAMQSLNDQKYIAGCMEAKRKASLEARVEVQEKHLAGTQ